jgi:hypothetical protein
MCNLNLRSMDICGTAMKKNLLQDIDVIILKEELHVYDSNGALYDFKKDIGYIISLEFGAYKGPLPEEVIIICV